MGSKKSSSPPPVEKVDPLQQARAQAQAQLETFPQAARAQFNVLADPEIGAQAQTQLFEDIRQQVFPGEQGVREQLVANTLSQLISPTGISQDQQQAIDARRSTAVEETQEALRNRANLGGGLFGGRAAGTEERAIGDLQNLFAEEDIAREERSRLNAQAQANAILQLLFPQSGIQTPQFVNPVASPNVQSQIAASQAAQDQNAILQQQAIDAQLRSSLFGALGQAGGGFLSRSVQNPFKLS